MPLVPELWLLSERAKMKEFTTFAVPRSFLPEPFQLLEYQWSEGKQTSSDPTRRFLQFYDWGNLNGRNYIFSYMGLEAYSEHFSDKFRHEEHPERVASFKKRADRSWKSGESLLSWKSGCNLCIFDVSRLWAYPKSFVSFQERVLLIFFGIQIKFG